MMPRTIEPYKAYRTDEFGDSWVFEYDLASASGIVTGSVRGLGGLPCPAGICPHGPLRRRGHIVALALVAGGYRAPRRPRLYGEELPGRTSKQGPAESFCPLCLRYQTEFEGHHVVWRMDGGSDHKKNLLPLCKSCHALSSHGGYEDRERRDRAAYCHQAARFGAAFFYNASTRKQPKERKTFRSLWPERVKGHPRLARLEQGRMLRSWYESQYIYRRDTALERLPRFDGLTLNAYEGNFKQFEHDRGEYMRRWEAANRRSA